MSGPVPFVPIVHSGTLVLTGAAAFLQEATGPALLMQLDPTMSGNYDQNGVVAAYNVFSPKGTGAAITVTGFVLVHGTQSVLHVVR